MRPFLSSDITDDEFEQIWRDSATVREVADRVGSEYGRAAARARRLRSEGRDLSFKRQMGGPLDDELFRAIWQSSRSVAEVASRLEQSPAVVSQRASNMRRTGHDLQKFKKGRPVGGKNSSGRSYPTHDEFRDIWVTSGGLEEVVARSGMSRAGITKRVRQMRADGYDLPPFKPGRPLGSWGGGGGEQAARIAMSEGISLTAAARRVGVTRQAASQGWARLFPTHKLRPGKPRKL